MPQISKFTSQLHSWIPEGVVKQVGWVVVGIGAVVVVVVGAGRVVVGDAAPVVGVVLREVEGAVVVVVVGAERVVVEVVGVGEVDVVGSTT
jgi:hypothetical protein